MTRPLGLRADHAACALCRDDRFLEGGGIPAKSSLGDSVTVLRHAEHAQCGGAMVGKVAMKVAPSAITGRIHAHDAVAAVRDLSVAELHVVAAAQRGRCV